MAKFLFEGKYTKEGIAGVQRDGGRGRREAIAAMVESAGGRLEGLYFALGETDVYVIAELPDTSTATSIALAVNGSGGATVKTVVLLTPDELDAASKRAIAYRPPGK